MRHLNLRRLPSPKYLLLILFGGIFLAFYLTILDYFFNFKSQTTIINNIANKKSRALQTKLTRHKLILLYTSFFNGHWLDYPRLGPLRPPVFEGTFSFQDCEVPWCEATYDKTRISEASAVGFHARDMPMPFEFPTERNPKQIWFYYVMENPLNVALNVSSLRNRFNWTMSYRRDSEIHIPYGGYSLAKNPVGVNKSYSEGKSRLAAWMVSNCISDERNEYVLQLRRHIPITIYGRCGEETCPLPRRSLECKKLLRQHKFYLAFENGNCIDYITEKYWENAIENEIVPIVMGGADYKSIAIPGSYIDVTDFSSPKQLAEYLKYLDTNDTAYSEYFRWKEQYVQVAPRTACTLCKQIHDSRLKGKPRVYEDLERFWGRQLCTKLNLIEPMNKTANSVPFPVMALNEVKTPEQEQPLKLYVGPPLHFTEAQQQPESLSAVSLETSSVPPHGAAIQVTSPEEREGHIEKEPEHAKNIVPSPSLGRQQNSVARQLEQTKTKQQYMAMPGQPETKRASVDNNYTETSIAAHILLKDV